MTINKFDMSVLSREEAVIFELRELYRRAGYSPYKMSKFEEYDTYARNKEYLKCDRVITFTDENGRMLALKPDVTISIIKNSEDIKGTTQKVYYNENVYRTVKGSKSLTEIMQTGIECLGDIDNIKTGEVLLLAARSLACISDRYVLEISHMDIIFGIFDYLGVEKEDREELLYAIGEKNTAQIKLLCDKLSVDDSILLRLSSVYGTLNDVLPILDDLNINSKVTESVSELHALNDILSGYEVYDRITVDFSVVNHLGYYNGIVMRGFTDGISTSILSGGRYDKLMKRMNRTSGAIGFAVYLDLLEELNNNKESFNDDMVNIALPKGRLGEKVYKMFAKAGYSCPEIEEENRKLVFENRDAGVRFFWVKPTDVAIYVERGAADIGVAGKDILAEYCPDVYELIDLDLGKCKMAVAAKKDFIDNKEKTLRVATKFPRIASEFYSNRSRAIDIIKLNGSIELAPLLGLSDVIVDIVETGKTLKENNLEVYSDIMKISARLVANKAGYRFKNNSIASIVDKLTLLLNERRD